jgi:hypothetical protein
MRQLKKEIRRDEKCFLKRTSKRILVHQIELGETGVVKNVKASFHTDPQNYGAVMERTTVPYSIVAINIGNRFY